MKVDLVIPMVFPTPSWAAKMKSVNKNWKAPELSPRWASTGLEKLQVELIWKFMPWLNKVFILLADEEQVQPWMKKEVSCEIVFHRDFIPAKHLPTFNSNTIEMFVPRIRNLSELFIYINDDMYPIKDLCINDFFGDLFKPRQQLVERQDFNFVKSWYYHVSRNAYHLVHKKDGQYLEYGQFMTPQHGMNPMLKSYCNRALNENQMHVDVSCTPFRSNCNLTQYFFCFYMDAVGVTAESRRKTKYIGTDPEKYSEMYSTAYAMRNACRGYDVLCANVTEMDSPVYYKMFVSSLSSYLRSLLTIF